MNVPPRRVVRQHHGRTAGARWRRAWRNRGPFWIIVMLACALSGVLYNVLVDSRNFGIGAIYATCIGGLVMLFEQGHLAPALRHWVRTRPWGLAVLATEAVFLLMTVIGTLVAGTLVWVSGAVGGSYGHAVLLQPVTTAYSLAVAAVLTTTVRMRDLIGGAVFRDVLLGRYHKPVEKDRIFLFIDLIGSTAYAQRHGDLRAQAFMGAIFAALADPVRDHGGAIDDYVGDMAMVTWRMREGLAEARCVTCVFAFLDEVAAQAERWRRDFGEVPRFRAALHGGRVVTAEVGIDRHKIAYFGDAVNTTGRLEALSREFDVPLLISGDLHASLPPLPEGLRARSLGAHALKGRGRDLEVLGIVPSSPSMRMPP